MAEFSEPSSCLSFNPSSPSSVVSISDNLSSSSNVEISLPQGQNNLVKLSSSLEQLLLTSYSDYCDAYIIVEGVRVGVNRCILAARSNFFHVIFEKGSSKSHEYSINEILPLGNVGYDAFRLILAYLYTGKLKPLPRDVSTCADSFCDHQSCRPAINFTVELMYAAFFFQLPELVSVFQKSLVSYLGSCTIEDVFPILIVAHHCKSSSLVDRCIERISRSDIDAISIEKELPEEIAATIKTNDKSYLPEHDLTTKRLKRIHKALDSDDVELVKLLLSESEMTLNEAYVLHYAVAYCDSKVVSELLALDLADVNLKNARGYTVLHVAAMRREPSIILSLLDKGACCLDLTSDGRSAVSICRRMTRAKEFSVKAEKCHEVNSYCLCIDVLDGQMRKNPTVGDAFEDADLSGDHLHMKLLYYENRVAFARMLYPTQARLAMGLAHADKTEEYPGSSALSDLGNAMKVDLNETPLLRDERLRTRLRALMKTVGNGRLYFPNCAIVIDKLMEDDLPDLFYLTKGTPDQQNKKKLRFRELKRDLRKAFDKDKAAQDDQPVISSSSSSASSNKHKMRRTKLPS